MSTSTTETRAPSHRRSTRSSKNSSPRGSASHHTSTPISTVEAGLPGNHRRSKRSSSCTSSSSKGSPFSIPTWVLLNLAGARRDNFPGDRTTSATTHTSAGDEVSVSFHLEEPPGTSVLTLDWPQGRPTSIYPRVIAADRDLVLFEVTCPKHLSPDLVSDYFIYQASSDPSRRSSLSKLPVLYSKRDRYRARGRRMQHIMYTDATGVLSLSDDSFVVADLETRRDAVDIYLLVSERDDKGKRQYGEWKVLKRLPVRCSNGDDLHMSCWSTDRVVPYRNHLVWVDYYKGMIFANIEHPWREPNLSHVPLPVDATKGMCDDWNYGRRCPEAYRNIFITSSVIKFVAIDRQHNSDSVVPLHRCGSTFRITTWSLCKYAGTWIEEATLDAEEFWALDSENSFPHVVPEFPVFNMRHPDAICFSLNGGSPSFGYSVKIWMVEVHMKKKRLLNATAYPEEWFCTRDQDPVKSARINSLGYSFISSEMPRYLCGEESCKKKRRQ